MVVGDTLPRDSTVSLGIDDICRDQRGSIPPHPILTCKKQALPRPVEIDKTRKAQLGKTDCAFCPALRIFTFALPREFSSVPCPALLENAPVFFSYP